jgi:CRP-like cAMP-binding protein
VIGGIRSPNHWKLAWEVNFIGLSNKIAGGYGMHIETQSLYSTEFHSKESDVLKATAGNPLVVAGNSKVPTTQSGGQAAIPENWSATGASISNRVTSPGEFAFIGRLRLFEDVSPEACSAIISRACVKHFMRHETIFSVGDAIEHVVLLLSGCVKITQQRLRGNKAILRLGGIGEVVGTFGVWSDCKYASTAHAIQPCTALVWDAVTFDSLLDRFSTFQRNTLRALDQYLQTIEERFRVVSTGSVSSRLSSELIRLSACFGDGVNGNGEICLTQTDLAQLTGTTLSTVSRVLTRWQKLGIVTTRREAVQIHNLTALMQFSRSA